MAGSFIDASGQRQQVPLNADIYRRAVSENLTVRQLLAREYPTDEAKYGSTMSQLMASTGLFVKPEPRAGIRAATLHDAMEGTFEKSMGSANVADATPTSRILFPAVVLELMESRLREDRSGDAAVFNQMVAITDSIAGKRYEQPILNYSRPEAARSRPISQLAEPSVMLTLTASETSRTLPTFSLGLVVSDQALQASTLDFVSLSIARQAEVERAALVDSYIQQFLNGDIDMGAAALTQRKANTLDASINAAGVLSHKAWIKWQRSNSRKRQIDWIICDTDTYLSIENRLGKPTQHSDDPTSPRLDSLLNLSNARVGAPNVYLVDDGVLPTNTIIGLDSRYAIRRIVSTSADYNAAEELVMRRGSQMRFDWGEVAYRMYDDAFDVLSLTL